MKTNSICTVQVRYPSERNRHWVTSVTFSRRNNRRTYRPYHSELARLARIVRQRGLAVAPQVDGYIIYPWWRIYLPVGEKP